MRAAPLAPVPVAVRFADGGRRAADEAAVGRLDGVDEMYQVGRGMKSKGGSAGWIVGKNPTCSLTRVESVWSRQIGRPPFK